MEEYQPVTLCLAVVVGYFLANLGYRLVRDSFRRQEQRQTQRKQSVADAEEKKLSEQRETSGAGGVPAGGAGGSSKRQAKSKKRREAQQEFTHSWMVGALKGHTTPVLDMSFSANGKLLASCAEDRTVLIWCTKDLGSKERKSLRVNIEYDHASLVRWSPDGKAFIIYKGLGGYIEVYKVTKKPDSIPGSATKALEFPKHHEEEAIGMDIACNGRYIITCSKRNDLVVWDLKGQILSTLDTYLGSTHRVRISPCGRFIAASGFTPDVNVWEVTFTKSGEFKKVAKCFDLAGHSSGVYDFTFNSDTSRMATVSKDGTYRFYDTKVEFEKGEDPRLILTGQWEGSTPATIALSPNAEIIVISHGSSLSFYSTVNGELDTTIENVFNGSIKCLTFDSLGKFILVAGDRHIKIFRNIPGYRASIETIRKKLSQRQTSATKERLEKTLADCEKFLKEMGEHCS